MPPASKRCRPARYAAATRTPSRAVSGCGARSSSRTTRSRRPSGASCNERRWMMNFQVLATDFDGTIAHDGHVDERTLAALQRASRAGLKLVMVTGRELSDLSNTFAHTDMFDRIVAENGALLVNPRTKATRL